MLAVFPWANPANGYCDHVAEWDGDYDLVLVCDLYAFVDRKPATPSDFIGHDVSSFNLGVTHRCHQVRELLAFLVSDAVTVDDVEEVARHDPIMPRFPRVGSHLDHQLVGHGALTVNLRQVETVATELVDLAEIDFGE